MPKAHTRPVSKIKPQKRIHWPFAIIVLLTSILFCGLYFGYFTHDSPQTIHVYGEIFPEMNHPISAQTQITIKFSDYSDVNAPFPIGDKIYYFGSISPDKNHRLTFSVVFSAPKWQKIVIIAANSPDYKVIENTPGAQDFQVNLNLRPNQFDNPTPVTNNTDNEFKTANQYMIQARQTSDGLSNTSQLFSQVNAQISTGDSELISLQSTNTYSAALQARWTAAKTLEFVYNAKLKQCNDSISGIIENYNSNFLLPPYDEMVNANNSIQYANILQYTTLGQVFDNNQSIVIGELNSFVNYQTQTRDKIYQCESSLAALNEAYDYQIKLKSTKSYSYWIAIFLSFILGFVFASIIYTVKNIQIIVKTIPYDFFEFSKAEKPISRQNLGAIISSGSIIAAISAAGGYIINNLPLDSNLKIVIIGTISLCLVSIVIGIGLAIVSFRKESDVKWQQWSWTAIIIAITAFLAIFFEVLFLIYLLPFILWVINSVSSSIVALLNFK